MRPSETPMRYIINTLKMFGWLIVIAPANGALMAHEFWIDPVIFELPADAPLVADIRVGQNFSGAAYAYYPPQFRRLDLVTSKGTQPVLGRPGDRPALNVPSPATGLITAVHVTGDMTLTYKDWAKFKAFVTHKDFAWATSDHFARGLPETGFKERYSRYAKSLFAVGNGAGQGRLRGLNPVPWALTCQASLAGAQRNFATRCPRVQDPINRTNPCWPIPCFPRCLTLI